MPRATWKGFLRLSLVSCPIYLTPATTRTKSISLNQVWIPRAPRPESRFSEIDDEEEKPASRPARSSPKLARERKPAGEVEQQLEAPEILQAAERIALHPVSSETGERVERSEVVKGYEFERGQFVTFTPEELKALDVESTRTVDLTRFVPRTEVDPVYFNAPYHVYPDGKLAAEAFSVIGAAMDRAGIAGLGSITLSRRERMALVEPRGASGMILITLRTADEVRAIDWDAPSRQVDEDMVAVAETIIQRRTGHFDPTDFRDRYQEALRELITAKLKGRLVVAKPMAEPAPVYDLMAALKRSLQQETGSATAKAKARSASDRRQRNLLLPMSGRGSARSHAVARVRSRKKA